MPLLQLKGMTKYFGGLAAVNGVDMAVKESEILGLIGPNGAGKTTLFNLINGFIPPTSGEARFKGELITGLHAHEIARRGIGRTFQQTVLFMESTVLENVFTGFHLSYRTGLLGQFLHTPAARRESKEIMGKAMEIVEFLGLGSQKDMLASNLPHGYQRVLGLCVALASNPALLLLDEPVAGMNPQETENMIRLIDQLRERGMTIVVVEHDMKAVMSLCDRIVVLNYGKKIAEGRPREIRENREVIEAYLGKEGAGTHAA
ncbi:MAG: ABC transporter ATP-binding protein [Deltaproteobacteria bacterium]|nr:ABC transporter ATP-binding protein [Deltaproteobacteria bacterium]MBW2136381.1 ABC transporter ATP-binding protein [Deltaproteobacteria bacterium]